MTPENALSQLFPSEPQQSRASDATASPATVELRPVLQRRIAAPVSHPVEVIDELIEQNEIEPERETTSPSLPVNTQIKTERITERIFVERDIEPARARIADDISAPALKPDRNEVASEIPASPHRLSDLNDSLAQKPAAVNTAPHGQPRDESPPLQKPSDQPAPVHVQQSPLSEKIPDRDVPHIVPAPQESQEPERKTLTVERVVRADSPRASEPEQKIVKADVLPRMEKPEPPDQTVSVKFAAPPKAEESGEPKIEQIATQVELKPATPMAKQSASVAEPISTPLQQPQAETDSPSDHQASPGGVTLRIGSIQITSKSKTPQRPQVARRPARSHQIEPRLPFASGRW